MTSLINQSINKPSIIKIQALWRGYIYKKALPTALEQSRVHTEPVNQFSSFLKMYSNNKCPFCGKKSSNSTRRSSIEQKEYKISGMCGECQRNFFK
uniref:Uncharacterized protein n=1 Tax=viral metagenome TaxID=1070528 RepID=A0A6C0J9I0_9ZZZZ